MRLPKRRPCRNSQVKVIRLRSSDGIATSSYSLASEGGKTMPKGQEKTEKGNKPKLTIKEKKKKKKKEKEKAAAK